MTYGSLCVTLNSNVMNVFAKQKSLRKIDLKLDEITISCLSLYCYLQGSLNKFPDFFRMGTFIDSPHMKL